MIWTLDPCTSVKSLKYYILLDIQILKLPISNSLKNVYTDTQ